MRKVKLELSVKDIYILWSLLCWITSNKKLAPHRLKAYLCDLMTNDERNHFRKAYDTEIAKEVKDTGTWLDKNWEKYYQ